MNTEGLIISKKYIFLIVCILFMLVNITGCGSKSQIVDNVESSTNIEINSDTNDKTTENETNDKIDDEKKDENIVHGGKIKIRHEFWYSLFNIPDKYIVERAYPDDYIDVNGYRSVDTFIGSVSLKTDNYDWKKSGISVMIDFHEVDADNPNKRFEIGQGTVNYLREEYSSPYEVSEVTKKFINGKTVIYYMERNRLNDNCSKITAYIYFSQEQLEKLKNEDKDQFYISISYENYDNPNESFDNLYADLEMLVNGYDGNYYFKNSEEDYTILR